MANGRNHLTEKEIRAAVLQELLSGPKNGQVLIEELGIGSARVDVAVASSQLLGYEIKSDFDTLSRLARQMHAYHEVFDALTIVTTRAYASQVEALLPPWWGIWVADRQDATVTIHQLRPAVSHGRQSPASLAAMLWREDAFEFAVEVLGPVVRARATRGDLQAIIAEHIPLEAIRSRVLKSLLSRKDLQARSQRAGHEVSDCQHKVVTRRVSTPRHVVA